VAAVKWIFVVLFALGGLSALGMGFVSGGVSRTPQLASAPPLSLRAFAGGAAVAVAAEKAPDEAAKTPEKTPEPVAAKTPEKAPEPVAAKTPEKAPESAKAPVAAAPVAAKPPPVAAAPAAPPAEGLLNLRASDTADVYFDGKKLGGSPLLGVKAKAGNHKVRFDCYDAAGNTMTGAAQTVSVKPDAETDIEFTCPAE
jgi:hypothetical protein